MRVWTDRTAGGEFLNGRAPDVRDIGPIVSTCRPRANPPRLNGVRVVHHRLGPHGWQVGAPMRWDSCDIEPIRVRTCRGGRR